MRFSYSVLVLTLGFLLIGGGCASTEDTAPAADDSGDSTTTEVTVEETGPVGFSKTGNNILSSMYSKLNEEGYKKFSFENIEGTCADMGLKPFSHGLDADLGYFIVRGNDDSYMNKMVATDAAGYVSFSDYPLEGHEKNRCKFKTKTGEDEATAVCTDPETKEELCTATLKVFASK
ncbi:MAG: hypothetical protein ABII02_00015 [Candidatus Magasanikbacteria bacterium]